MSQNTGSRMVKESDGYFEGIIVASNWDTEGRVIQVSLLTKSEDEYVLFMDNKGKSLISHCQKEVKIKASLNVNNTLTIIHIF